jgi:YfiH family protein
MRLPETSQGFRWVQEPSGPALACNALEPLARHFFTTRGWRLGSATADSMREAWAEVAGAAHVPAGCLVRVHQVHGADVVVASPGREATGPLPQADIIVCSGHTDALAIQTADCVPLLIIDRRTGAYAAAHAGWRGLGAGVPGVTIAALAREFGSLPGDLLAVAGPSIGPCCYEVGGDVHARFAAAWSGETCRPWFHARPRPTALNPSMPGLPPAPRADHWYFDGWSATRDQLAAAGIPAAQIFIAELCTASHQDVFCSYRRDGAGAGRMAAAIRSPTPRP